MPTCARTAHRHRARRAALAGLARLAALGLLPSAAALRAAEPLRVGLAPFLSPAALLATFRPLREHLGQALGQPVEMYTARDFPALAGALQRGEYDLAFVPAHLGWLAIEDWGWVPAAGTVQRTQVQVLVRAGGPVRSSADLRGRRVGMLDPLSLVAAVGTAWLQAQGLGPPAGAERVTLPSINSALHALDRDELAAVVAASTQLLGLPPGTPGSYRLLAGLGDIPGPVYLARPGLPADTLARWRAALLSFQPDPQRPSTAANTRPTPLDADALAPLAPYAELARQVLAPRR